MLVGFSHPPDPLRSPLVRPLSHGLPTPLPEVRPDRVRGDRPTVTDPTPRGISTPPLPPPSDPPPHGPGPWRDVTGHGRPKGRATVPPSQRYPLHHNGTPRRRTPRAPSLGGVSPCTSRRGHVRAPVVTLSTIPPVTVPVSVTVTSVRPPPSVRTSPRPLRRPSPPDRACDPARPLSCHHGHAMGLYPPVHARKGARTCPAPVHACVYAREGSTTVPPPRQGVVDARGGHDVPRRMSRTSTEAKCLRIKGKGHRTDVRVIAHVVITPDPPPHGHGMGEVSPDGPRHGARGGVSPARSPLRGGVLQVYQDFGYRGQCPLCGHRASSTITRAPHSTSTLQNTPSITVPPR